MSTTLYGSGRSTGLLLPALGQCRVSLVSGSLVLKPYMGNLITINGKYEVIPAAGTPGLAYSGTVSPFTAFDIYAYMDSNGTMQLEKAANGSHSTDPATGVEIKTVDSTRTLVAKAGTGTAGNVWINSADARLIINWFNRRRVVAVGSYGATRSLGATSTWTELDGAARVYFLSWGDQDEIGQVNGVCVGATAGSLVQTGIALDSITAPSYAINQDTVPLNGAYISIDLTASTLSMSEGLHYASLLSWNASGSSQWNANNRMIVQG